MTVDEAENLALGLCIMGARVVEKMGVNVIEVAALRDGVTVVIGRHWSVTLATAAMLTKFWFKKFRVFRFVNLY